MGCEARTPSAPTAPFVSMSVVLFLYLLNSPVCRRLAFITLQSDGDLNWLI